MTNQPSTSPPVLDYDGAGDSSYRTDFWEGTGREYEDRVERIALKRLLQPAQGKRLLELGAGFGRLSEFFSGYEQVILLDYAKSQLEDARARLGDDKFIYVAANVYQLPINDGACDAATMIRVIHHFADVAAALKQVRAAMSPGAVFILEYANKRNLKAMLRYTLGTQQWRPYDENPIEFVPLHFDFHPRYMKNTLVDAGFQPTRRLPVSYLRIGLLKRLFPARMLAGMDALLQSSGLLYSPSIFSQNRVAGERPSSLTDKLFKCPVCSSTDLSEGEERLICGECGRQWSKASGVYDFREPMA
jgi:SAM-dependent methyltransferase/ribosomal protein S27AE